MFGRQSRPIAGVIIFLVLGGDAYAANGTSVPPIAPPDVTVAANREYAAQPSVSIDADDGIHMGSADKLQIKFQGLADLTGEYRLSPDGSISLPVIGRVKVGQLTASELEALLAERVARVTSREAFVTVEIIEYRPIFVSGFVAKPGSFPWRPGMNVLQAVALAGGAFRNVGESGPGLQDSAELERLQKAIAGQGRNLAIRARLDAELNDADAIIMPPMLVTLVGKAAADDFIKSQTRELLNRKASLEAKRAAISKALDTSEKELNGLAQQSARLDTQLNIRVKYKKQIDDLQSRGYARSERSIEELSKVSDLEDRGVSLAVGKARLQTIIAQLERDDANLDHERRADVGTEIFKLGREIAQLEIEIDAARSNYKKITGQEPLMTLEPSRKSVVRYEIVRQSPSGSDSIVSDQMAALKPGDVLVVAFD